MKVRGICKNGIIIPDSKLKENQRVMIIPIKETALGGLHKYANINLIQLEKKALQEEIVRSYLASNNRK